jgi:hypothetical protein
MSEKIFYRAGYLYQLYHTYEIQLPFKAPVVGTEHEFLTIYPSGMLRIECGYAWDGPSGPTVDTKDFMRGSLVHDALYQLMRDGLLDRKVYREKADDLLRAICREDGMSAVRAWIVYQGVRRFGEHCTMPRTNEIVTAP